MDDILLISVGGNPAPIMHSILTHRPAAIVFFVSPGSRPQVAKDILPPVLSQLGRLPDHEFLVTPDEQDVGACTFALLDETPAALRRLGRPDLAWPPLVDFTGGTKPMSAAMVWAASHHPCRFVYVGARSPDQRTNQGLGTVRDGGEFPMVDRNPWDRIAFYELRDAMLLFDRLQFRVAQRRLEALKERVRDDEVRRLLGALADIAEGFHEWDIFNHKPAFGRLEKGARELRDLARLLEPRYSGLTAFATALGPLVETVKALRDGGSRLVADLLANARRRGAVEHRYEDAVARTYAAIEKHVHQTLREDFDLDPSNAAADRIPDALRDEYERRYRQPEGRMKFGLVAGLHLLRALGDLTGERFAEREKRIRGDLDQRNQSILAHGDQPMKAKHFDALFEDALYLTGLTDNDLVAFPRFRGADVPGRP